MNSMMFEVLNCAFVRFRSVSGIKRSQIFTLAGFGVFLSGIEPILARFQFSDHL